jgi:predicted aconitase with swiveling domain
MSKTFKGRPVVAGKIDKGDAIVSHNGVNTLATFQKTVLMHDLPLIGKDQVIGSDQNNPDVFGKNLTGKVLCLPQTIGSTTGGMVLYTVSALKMAPCAMLFSQPIDSLAAAGVILADVWTENSIVAVDSLGEEFLNSVKDGDKISVSEDGTVTVE